MEVYRFEADSYPQHIPGFNAATQEVMEGRYETALDGDIMALEDVESCLVIAVQHSVPRCKNYMKSYLGHFPLEIISFSHEPFSEMLDEVKAGYEDYEYEFSSKVNAWLGGASLLDNADPEDPDQVELEEIQNSSIEAARLDAVRLTREIVPEINEIKTEWLKENEKIPELAFIGATILNYKAASVL